MSMNRKTGNGFVSWCASGLCLLLLAGCGSESDRSSLEGTVTLNGQPLAEGSIALRPLPGTRGPTAGGKITNGTFAILPEQGTFAGTFRVEITASRKTGKQTKDTMLGIMVDDYERIIPDRYNRQSELTAEVTEDGPNHFEFTLSSP